MFLKCETQNWDLLAFYHNDLIIFYHFPKILIDKNQKPEAKDHKLGNYDEENNFICKSYIGLHKKFRYYGNNKAESWHLSMV